MNGTPALVEIVADGGHAVGFGHLGRCLAIAELLGAEAAFTVGDQQAQEFVRARGARAGAPASAAVVLLDRRAPTADSTVRAFQAVGRRVALLDDRGPGRLAADLVIDPPTAAGWPPAGGRRLHGFEHALVRAEVVAARAGRVPVDGRILLGMGGSDPAGLTVPLAAALAAGGLDLEVACGPGYRGERPSHGRLLASPAEWIGALSRAALVVCGFGHSLLEATCLGVPAVAVVFLPEHREHARAFARAGTAETIEMTEGARPRDLAALVAGLLADSGRLAAMGARGRALVDGHGARRVAGALGQLARPAAVAL